MRYLNRAGISILFIFLTLVAPNSVWGAGLCSAAFDKSPRLPLRMSNHGLQLLELPVDGVVHVGVDDLPYDSHVFTNRGLIQSLIRDRLTIKMRPIRLENGSLFVCAAFGCLYVAEQIEDARNSDRSSVVLTDVTGTQYSATSEYRDDANGKLFAAVTFHEYHPAKKNQQIDLSEVRAQFNQIKDQIKTRQGLAHYFRDQQLKKSANAADPEAGLAYRAAIEKAGFVLAQANLEGRLTVAHLERLNFLVNQGINPYRSSENAYLAGVMRGTRNRLAEFDGRLQTIDLSDYQVHSGIGNFILAYFAPSTEVPRMVDSLLLKINSVNPQTSISTILEIFRTFISIHPFSDGNGRTARLLLNYMLIKAELPLPNRALKSIWVTNDQLVAFYLASVRPEKK